MADVNATVDIVYCLIADFICRRLHVREKSNLSYCLISVGRMVVRAAAIATAHPALAALPTTAAVSAAPPVPAAMTA